MNEFLTQYQIRQKLEYFCSYQERCHVDVESKLFDFKLSEIERNEIIVYLIENDFLNETRFACSYARGKHRIKHWGKIRIVNELKFRKISSYNINLALKEFSEDEYLETFEVTAMKIWDNIQERDVTKKRKKWCDYLLRKGWESNLVYEKAKELVSKGQ
jgi:regulatory protein